MISKALTFLALVCAQTQADKACKQDETSLLQISSAMKFGDERTEKDEEASLTPPAYKKPSLASEGPNLRVSWKLPSISHPVQSTAIQVRAVGDSAWQFVDSERNKLVVSGGNSVAAPGSSILITTLDSARLYEARVAMKNSEGWGDYSPTSEAIALVAPERQESVKLEEEGEAKAEKVKVDEDAAENELDEAAKSELDELDKAAKSELAKVTEVHAVASKAAAKQTLENAVNARSALQQAEAKNNAAQKEVAEKAVAAKASIWEAYQTNHTATKAVAIAKKADTASEAATAAAEASATKKASAQMMLDAAEELAAQTVKELKEAKKKTAAFHSAKKAEHANGKH